jgi:hypothetical protein
MRPALVMSDGFGALRRCGSDRVVVIARPRLTSGCLSMTYVPEPEVRVVEWHDVLLELLVLTITRAHVCGAVRTA